MFIVYVQVYEVSYQAVVEYSVVEVAHYSCGEKCQCEAGYFSVDDAEDEYGEDYDHRDERYCYEQCAFAGSYAPCGACVFPCDECKPFEYRFLRDVGQSCSLVVSVLEYCLYAEDGFAVFV